MRSLRGKPNILLILTDQHSRHITGFSGNRTVDTGALDALAQQGAQFDTAYFRRPNASQAGYRS
jgi:choline-sulfatase